MKIEDDELVNKIAFLTPRSKKQLDKALTYIAADSPRQAEIMERQFS